MVRSTELHYFAI